MTSARRELELVADCSRCFALCCVAPAFARSADFAIDKAAGQPCPNLLTDHRCSVHERLRSSGFAGCTVYDCFGAGQHVAQLTFGGVDWRAEPASASDMFAVLPVMRALHELLWLLDEARRLAASAPLFADLDARYDETAALTEQPAAALLALDLDAHREAANALLVAASERARAGHPHRRDLRGADLVGGDLHDGDLRGASLRGASLVGADLTGADLTDADLRGADVSGADLSSALFLSQAQLDSARGDARSLVPAGRRRPAHWPG